MQDEQTLLRTRHIIDHLAEVWRDSKEFSPEILTQITEFVRDLDDPYKSMGYKVIAERFINNMSLHILHLLSIFHQKAEEEQFSSEDRKKTIDHALRETFKIVGELQISIQSLDDLGALGTITTGLQTLSETDSAEDAQSWLYELPTMYYCQLSEDNLITKQIQISQP